MILRDGLLLCVLISLLSGNVANKSSFNNGTQNQYVSQNNDIIDRLSTNVKLISYNFVLNPQIQNNTFSGFGTINVVIQEHATKNITLHAGSIEIEKVQISVFVPNRRILLRNYSTSYNNITEMYTISTFKTFAKNEDIEIYFLWKGNLSDKMVGFYKSSYFDENGQIKWLAATQFQTTYARNAFPCFDEPNFKAKFIMDIIRDDNYRSVSNTSMPLVKTEKLNWEGKSRDTFNQSIPMPTYLVAFVISEFDFLNSTSSGEIQFKIWSKPSTINQTRYALKIGTTAIELFKKKFNQIELPMDIVAVPGSIENSGLMYRERDVLYDEKESSTIAQQRVASVIVHKLTHQYFGNLTIPESWNYLWLSEAFARYFEYFGVAEIETTWNMKEQFVIEQHQVALVIDSISKYSSPMTRENSHKSQIGELVKADYITYNKGASIVRMMNLIFGTKIFEDALHSYIQNNKVKGSIHPDDLWKAIQTQVSESVDPRLKSIDVKTIMDTWTTQTGYPVVTITINDGGVINITQNRFLLTNITRKSPTNHTWSIPLTFTSQSKPDFNNTIPKYWMSTETYTVSDKVDPKEWIIFNVQSSDICSISYRQYTHKARI